jgi:eukaryotic-like serine/threonine-protein kinase
MNHPLKGFSGTARYAPKRLLGTGGMGAVYEVEDQTGGSRVALKLMLDANPARLLRFKHEFRVMAELHHPNLVRLFELGQHEGRWFFTMELVDGQNLVEMLLDQRSTGTSETLSHVETPPTVADRPQDSSAPTKEAPAKRDHMACDSDVLIRVVGQILDALAYLHDRGIVHRDLKPSNILVGMDGMVRVLDFGLASRADRTMQLSQEGAIVGTLPYLSPEQWKGAPASAASDLYALGCIMFELITGSLPYAGVPVHALATRVERAPPRLSDHVAGVPEPLVEVVHRLMSRDPAERPTIAEVRRVLGIDQGRSTPRFEKPATEIVSEELFVGRERELDVLSACLSRAARGTPQLAFVSGPSGIGKSALGSVLSRRASARGFICLRGRCFEREQLPFVAFDRVIDALTLSLRGWPANELAALRPALMKLERLFPTLGMLTGGQRDVSSPGRDPRELHRQVFDAFREIVAACQSRAPLFFVFDDLQWADEDSLALLESMLATLEGRIMVLGLFRADRPGAEQALTRLASGRDRTSIDLEALRSDDAIKVIDLLTKGGLEPDTSRFLASQALGNPFLLRALAEHVATAKDEWTSRLEGVSGENDLLRKMLDTLTPRAEQVLALAATAGGELSRPLLRETSGLGAREFDLAEAELLSARYVKAVPPPLGTDAPVHIDVYHDRIREVVYLGLEEERKKALHRTLALGIEAHPSDPGRDVELLVRHWTGAGDRTRRRRFALEAAERAEKKLAFAHAARLFRLVLDDPETSEGGEDPTAIAARWERVGELFECAGLHHDAADAYQRALQCWEGLGGSQAGRAPALIRLLGLVGVHRMATEQISEGRAAFARGLELMDLRLDRSPVERAAVIFSLRQKSVIAARFGGSKRPRKDASVVAAQVQFLDHLVRAFQPLWPLHAAEAGLRAQLVARQIDDQRIVQRSLAFGAAAPLFLGRCTPPMLNEAHRRLDLAEALAVKHDLPLGRELVQMNRAVVWLPTDMGRARRASESALAGIAKLGMSNSFDGYVARAYHLHVLMLRGDEDEALAATDFELDSGHENVINRSIALACRVRILARRGSVEEAEAALAMLTEVIKHKPLSRPHFSLVRTRAATLVAAGRYQEALAIWIAGDELAKETAARFIALDRSLWLEAQLEAAIWAARRGALAPELKELARRSASWLARNGAFDFCPLGYRALAYLEKAEGRERASVRALEEAVTLSATNTSPHHRWLCLEAARELAQLSLDQQTEAEELAGRGRFAFPPGWAA